MTTLSYAAALESAMAEEMRRDPRVYTMATSPSPALLSEYGPMRVKRMPISEATMAGIAVGSAGCGYRPVVHWGSVTFAFMAFDQVVNQACKLGYMVHLALAAAEELAAEGTSVEVIDPRTLVPLDVETIRQSIHKTGRLVVVDESAPICSMASEIMAVVAEDWESCRMLRAPVR